MDDCICRAITFISYHIPIPKNMDAEPQYTTIGFFDGLYTERIRLTYAQDNLYPLWNYTLKRTIENKGYYSFQNTFGFSKDEWNNCTDEYFWTKDADENFPLVFVVFMQLSGYMSGGKTIENQCRKFNQIVKDCIGQEGLSYVYGTVDKNDFIVCIRSKEYKKAVKSIKSLHNTCESVIYSYTIFSVKKEILEKIKDSKEQYQYLYAENIDSICLKGITNSSELGNEITLDQKYYAFCGKLVKRLYGISIEEPNGEDPDRKLYDILGDDDFRLIARMVSLGNLLREFASDGMLWYKGEEFSFYLFSSSFILNTLTVNEEEKEKFTEQGKKVNAIGQNNRRVLSQPDESLCSELERLLKSTEILPTISHDSYDYEKIITIYQALYQLLQSLKVLERAPTKKYDFFSLYFPFSQLVNILAAKWKKQKDIGEIEEIYDFIHTISMTLHGTLRTDIQFFQIRDFNVITHYAPAKLRAFYSMWTFKLSNYYNMIGKTDSNQKEYSFVIAPGMYKGTEVKQLFEDYKEEKRLMLVAVPERHLYSVKWLSVILAHEVSHFVGNKVRNRSGRHEIWLEMIMRILELELYSFTYAAFKKIDPSLIEIFFNEKENLWENLESEILEQEKKLRKKYKNKYTPYEYHSDNSREIIQLTHRNFLTISFQYVIYDYTCQLKNFIREIWKQPASRSKKTLSDGYLNSIINRLANDLVIFYEMFQKIILDSLLGIIKDITTESFADMMAIFTLGITPKEYISSFVNSEIEQYAMDNLADDEATAVSIRIALVMQVVSKAVEKNSSCPKNQLSDLEEWEGDALVNCARDLSISSAEGKVAYKALGYRDKITYFDKKIGSYRRLYDSAHNRFFDNVGDYWEDKILWDKAYDYLEQCAEIYIKELSENAETAKIRKEISDSYKKISRSSSVQLMQEIEDFLAKSEKDFVK